MQLCYKAWLKRFMLGEEDLGVTSVWAVDETFAARVPTLHLCTHCHTRRLLKGAGSVPELCKHIR